MSISVTANEPTVLSDHNGNRDCGVGSAYRLLISMLSSSLINPKRWEALSTGVQDELRRQKDVETLLTRLLVHELLTDYQVERALAGRLFGLVLGNYRVLERIGVGGMGVVYKAEHLRLPRYVAIKVLSLSPSKAEAALDRFSVEMEAIARLNHPNIVGAIDAGMLEPPTSEENVLYYFVMDYVPGRTLEELVEEDGPMAMLQACDAMHQVASALAEAHRQGLVHRDIKPSNVLMTPEGQAKLLDFGLARPFDSRLTEPGTVLGTLDYLPPEQAEDATTVDERADLFSLGGTFFWCLTGRPPFQSRGNIVLDLAARLNKPAPGVQQFRAEVPDELASMIARLLAIEPSDRFGSAEELRRALFPFLRSETYRSPLQQGASALSALADQTNEDAPGSGKRILIVDDEAGIREICRIALEHQGFATGEAKNGAEARHLLKTQQFDLALLDIDLPDVTGIQLLKEIRSAPPSPHFKAILFSGGCSGDEMATYLSAGADDYATKPISLIQLASRIKSALRLKEAQERTDRLNQHLLTVNRQLEQNLNSLDGDLIQARNALVIALAGLVGHRDSNVGQHLCRMQYYCRVLAESASKLPGMQKVIDANFIQMLECVAPLHDIGKVGLPDHVLLKPGKFDQDERVIMQTHTTIGADTLEKVAKQHSFSVAFFQMAIDVARYHHERWDGNGYPDGLAGEGIPLAARIVAIADSYDALRSRRTYKPALSHATVLQMLTQPDNKQFDPNLLQALRNCGPAFERIYRQYPD